MLDRLKVSNLAIVEKAEVEFASGLNVLTGETGAGKSVLMGALELVTGARADSGIVREGEKEARVEAEFTLSPSHAAHVRTLLEDVGIDFDGESLVVRRTVAASGTGRVWVNDSPTTVSTLKKLGAALVDIHGPRANQNILEERFQRSALDSFADVDFTEYSKSWTALVAARESLATLEKDSATADELDMLRYQVGELEAAEISEDDDDIAARHAAAAHAGELVEAANDITEALGGDSGAAETLIRIQPRIAAIAKRLPVAEGWSTEVEEITLRIQELSRSVADVASEIDADPDTLAALDERLAVVNRLKRRHGCADAKSLLSVLAAKKARLDDIERREERLSELEKEVRSTEEAVRRNGASLSKKRKSAATRLAKAVMSELRDLGFLQAEFSVSVEPCEPDSHGCDRIAYMFGPNPGEPSRQLAAIASSGEAARVMLALKRVLSSHDSTDVLVFDEIDANIGGEVGRIVGEKMRAVAQDHQVIAITHLPQSAACGDRHMVVSKSISGGRTRTRIEAVDGEARAKELARMLGGGESGVVAKHAEELLSYRRNA